MTTNEKTWTNVWSANDNLHTVPNNDTMDHELTWHCPCGPELKALNAQGETPHVVWHLTHDSLDGREASEGLV